MSAEFLGVVSSLRDPLAHDDANALGRQSFGRYMPMPINAPEDRGIFDPGDFKPSFQRGNWTSLRTPERDADLAPDAVLIGLRFA